MKESGGDVKKKVVILKLATQAASNTTQEQFIMVKDMHVKKRAVILKLSPRAASTTPRD